MNSFLTAHQHYIGYADAVSAALASCSAVSGVQTRLLVRQALCGEMPKYLADDVHLVSEGNRRSLRSSSDNVCGATYAQQLRGQKLWRCRSANLEQSAVLPANT